MRPHHRTAIALRAVRESGGRVRVLSTGATLAFHVASPCAGLAVREVLAAGFAATGAFVYPPGWQHTLLVPASARMTAALLALDGTGPLGPDADAHLTRAGVADGAAGLDGAGADEAAPDTNADTDAAPDDDHDADPDADPGRHNAPPVASPRTGWAA
jgi:hypothetical protein